MPTAAPPSIEERHATWLELFFDLVIVVAVAQLAHLLADGPGIHEAFLFGVCYYAMWSTWTAFTLYANVAATKTHTRSMLLAMFGIAIMAASVPHVLRGEPNVFIIAYIYCRLLAAGSWKRTGSVMTEWPAVQQATAVIPWFASLGFDPPVRYWLWTAGVVLDVVVSLVRSRDPNKLLADEQAELDSDRRQRERREMLRQMLGRPPRKRSPETAPVVLTAAAPDRPHLGERLGLFVIIVLGEAVAQLVDSASEVEHWGRPLYFSLIISFGLLIALWWLTLQYGAGGAPTYGARVFTLRLTMPLHYLMTGSLVLIAAGLGALAGHSDTRVPEANRWVLCAGAGLYYLTATLMGVRGGATRRWILGWGVPSVVASILLGLFGGPLAGWALSAIVLAITLWQVAYRRFDPHAGQPAGDLAPAPVADGAVADVPVANVPVADVPTVVHPLAGDPAERSPGSGGG
jgi:low temperature requirement protein LtrA